MLASKTKGVAGLVGFFIGVMVLIIVAVSVIIPTIDSQISAHTGNVSNPLTFNNYSSASTLINLSPLLIAVVLILAIVGAMKLR